MYYAVGALKDRDAKEVELVIVQPRARHREGPVRRWRVSAEKIRAFEAELKAAIAETKKPDAKLCAGSHCKWCTAKPVCETMSQQVMEITKTDFNEFLPPEPSTMSMEDLAKVLLNTKMAVEWFSSVGKHAFKLAESGIQVPHHKLVKKRANLKWVDTDDVVSAFGDGEEIYVPRKLKSPAQMEKIMGKEAVAELAEKPDTGNTIAPWSDKREEVRPSAVMDFS